MGILIAAKQQGFISSLQPILDDLKANGFWIHDRLYTEILLLAGE